MNIKDTIEEYKLLVQRCDAVENVLIKEFISKYNIQYLKEKVFAEYFSTLTEALNSCAKNTFIIDKNIVCQKFVTRLHSSEEFPFVVEYSALSIYKMIQLLQS
jgi:hypothetical protein